MSESDAAGAVAEPVAPATEEAVDKGEGTTPEEVAKILNLPADKPAASAPVAKVDDAEEGDDPDEVVADEPDEVVAEKPTPPEAPISPDEATTDDKYSFQIQDANGATFKISADAKMDDILSECEPKSNGQIIDILDQLREIKDLKKADEAKAADDKVAEDRRSRASELLTSWQEEAKTLQGDKRIPDGADGTKRINAVYKYMSDENTKRMEAGKATLNSFEDALDKLENKEARDDKIATDKAEKERIRSNGALVGGSSAAASTGPPIYRAGSSRNSNEALRSMGLL